MIRAVRTAALLFGTASLAVLTGCGGESTAGTPVATDPAPSGESSVVPPTSTAKAPDDYSLARLCELLEPDEAERLGGSAQGRKGNSIRDGHDLCTWEHETSLIARVQPGLKIAGMPPQQGATLSPESVEGLTAVRRRTADIEACEILVDLPSGNLFSVSVAPLSAGEGKYDPCALVDEFAAITVPRVKDD